MPSWVGCMPSGRRSPIAAARGEDPAGATMYVTLEPCAHQGRQPPCAEAILEAGIGRVVIASEDPSEKAAGRGPGILRDGGVEVAFAAGAEADRRAPPQPALPQARPHRPAAGRPEDGDVARRPDHDRGRRLALDLRPERAASWSTTGAPNPTRSPSASAPALADDPLLTARIDGARQPIRVDLRLQGPPAARLAAPRDPRRGAPVSSSPPPRPTSRRVSALASAGAEVLIAGDRSSRPSPSSAAATSPASSSRAADPRLGLPRRRPDRRIPYLRRPGAARSTDPRRHLARVATMLRTPPAGEPVSETGPARHEALSRPSTGRRRHPDHGRPSRSGECSPGLVEDVGRVEASRRTPRRPAAHRHQRWPPRSRLGDSVAVNGVCLTATEVDGSRLRDRGDEPDARGDRARRPRGRRRGQPGAGDAGRRAPRRPHRPGPRRRRRRRSLDRARTVSPGASGSSSRPSCCATSSTRARSPSAGSA